MTESISIGLLTHNYGRYLPAALDSVLAQDFRDWELLVCDDCSNDNTRDVVAPYLNDKRIRYVRHDQNIRQGANWEFSMHHSRASLLATLHADDWWMPNALSTVIEAFMNNDELDLLSAAWRAVDADGTVLHDQSIPRIDTEIDKGGSERRYISEATYFTRLPSVSFIRREVLHKAGPPRTDLDMLVDYEFFLRVTALARQVCSLPQVLAMYRTHSAGITQKTARDGRQIDEARRMAKIAKGHPGATPRTIAAVRRRMANLVRDFGLAALLRGDGSARSLLIESCKLSPLTAMNPLRSTDIVLASLGRTGTAMARCLHPTRAKAVD